jgi:hypothetical protein
VCRAYFRILRAYHFIQASVSAIPTKFCDTFTVGQQFVLCIDRAKSRILATKKQSKRKLIYSQRDVMDYLSYTYGLPVLAIMGGTHEGAGFFLLLLTLPAIALPLLPGIIPMLFMPINAKRPPNHVVSMTFMHNIIVSVLSLIAGIIIFTQGSQLSVIAQFNYVLLSLLVVLSAAARSRGCFLR